MRQELLVLEELFKVQQRISGLEVKLDHVPEPIRALERELELLEKAHTDLKGEHKTQADQRHEKRRELDLETLRLRNAKKKEAQVSNQREMEAFLREISTVEQTIRELESQVSQLDHLEKAAAERLKEHDGKLERVRKDVHSAQKRHEEENHDGEAELDGLYDKRDGLFDKLSPRVRDIYHRISERAANGLAVAHTGGGVCSACHMSIPMQMYNELLTGDRFHQCPSCRRILLPDRNAFAAKEAEPVEKPKATKPKATKAAATKAKK